jgi:hypothetical protein
MQMEKASIVVDLRHLRCSHCKVALDDELATYCPVCSAVFAGVMSNHVGLVEKLKRKRRAAGIKSEDNTQEQPILVHQ